MKEQLKQYITEFEEKYDAKVVYVTLSGSKLYGTDTPKSDTDFKGLFVPSEKSVIMKTDPTSYVRDTNTSKEKNTAEDIDFTLHSVYSFFNLLKKSETGSVDVLFSMFRPDTIVYESKDFTTAITDNYKLFLNKEMGSFIGYALGQTKKFGIKGARYGELDSFVKEYLNKIPAKLVTKEIKSEVLHEDLVNFIKEKDYKYIKFVQAQSSRGNDDLTTTTYLSILGKLFSGDVSVQYLLERVDNLYNQFGNRTKTIAGTETKTDFKALSHSLRIAEEVKELLETNFIKFPLRNAEHIRDIKEGKVSVEEAIEEVRDVLAEVDELLLNSDLPDKSSDKVDLLLYNLIRGQL